MHATTGCARSDAVRPGPRPLVEVDELLEVIRDGDMPPTSYTLIHPEARLTYVDRVTLLATMRQMLRDPPPIEGEDGSGREG
jgi:Haem-binding domain